MLKHCQQDKLSSLNTSQQPPLFRQHPFFHHSPFFPTHLSWFNKRHLDNIDPYRTSNVKLQEPEPSTHLNYKFFENTHSSCKAQVKIEEKPYYQPTKEEREIEHQRKIHHLAAKKAPSDEERNLVKEYRKMCMKKYFEKKLIRSFEKKIVYDTRKRVADRRIRFKGRFINEIQARQLLGIESGQFTFEELKQMMKKLGKEQ